MSQRDIIRMVLEGEEPPYVPWSMGFTKEPRETLEEHFGTRDLDTALDNHILGLGSAIGFFEDLADSWRGWEGQREYRSLEGELTLAAAHDGLAMVTLAVQMSQPSPPGWSAAADLELGAGADLEAQARAILASASNRPG